MVTSCVLTPRVRNLNGEWTDSKLYSDLLEVSGNDRKAANRIYGFTQSKEFLEQWKDTMQTDINGEPTLGFLCRNFDVNEIINEKKMVERMEDSINKEPMSFEKAYDAMEAYNRNNPLDGYKRASVKKQGSGYKVFLKDIDSGLQESEISKSQYNKTLNDKLRDILARKGVGIAKLEEMEKDADGVIDFNKAHETAEGLVYLIRLAHGERGERALPEEFAHFMLAALEDSPLVRRLYDYLESNDNYMKVLGEEYDAYRNDRQYLEDNKDRLVKEAAGKLMAMSLNGKNPFLQYREVAQAKNFLQRIKDFFKQLFGLDTANEIENAIRDAARITESMAKDLMEGNLEKEISVSNITEKGVFKSINERVARDRNILQRIINNELKRLDLYQKSRNQKFSKSQEMLIDKLELHLESNMEIEGIYQFMQEALKIMEQLKTRMDSVMADNNSPLATKAYVLRNINNYLMAYGGVLNDIRKGMISEIKLDDNRYGERMRILLDELSSMMQNLSIEFDMNAKPVFISFIKQYMGESIVIPFGKDKGKRISAEELVSSADRDIGFLDRWLNSMAESGDYILRIFDRIVKEQKGNARLDTIEVVRMLEDANRELEKSGIRNTEWMYERDEKGNLTGRFISEVDWNRFKKDKKEFFEDLDKRYGEELNPEMEHERNREIGLWFNEHTEKVNGKSMPKKSMYRNPLFNNLSAAQKKYYDTVISLKEELDKPFNLMTSTLNAPKIRKDLVERVKQSRSVGQAGKALWEDMKDRFMERSDDTDFGVKNMKTDFEGRPIYHLPVYYLKIGNDESLNDMSTDVTSTMMAYASMALDYKYMSKVIDELELGRMVMEKREVERTSGDNSVVERIEALGRTVENKIFKPKYDERFLQMLDDFFEMQVYGKRMKDEGTIGKKISKGKLANFINTMTALYSTAMSPLSAISNVATGSVMMRIESWAGEYFNAKDMTWANATYTKHLPALLSQMGNRVKTSKLYLWNELFNVSQEYERQIKEKNFDRKTWFSRMFSTSTLFFMNNAGEHWMNTAVSLAMGHKYKMKDRSGNIVSLWDAMEVRYTDPNDHSKGARLVVKEGYRKMDGTEFTRKDILAFENSVKRINQSNNGIYNELDKSAINRYALGRMAIMYRKWIVPSINRRFAANRYNFDINDWQEGYYRTSFRFIGSILKDLKHARFALASNWKNLTKKEKKNIYRALTELGHFLALCLATRYFDDDDDDPGEKTWFYNTIEYQTRRLRTEIGVMTPGLSMATEGLRIAQSPAAGLNMIEALTDMVKAVWIPNWFEEVESGRYEGQPKALKALLNSPLVPMNKTIYRALHPEESIPFYKQ